MCAGTSQPTLPDWQLLQTSVKPWPSCRHTHPAIDAALSLYHRLAGREIRSVSADVYQATLDVCDRPEPQSEYEGKFSIYRCIAAALSDGRVEFESFSDESRTRLSALRRKITVQLAEPYKSAYPDKFLPPVSNWVRVKFFAAICAICRPTRYSRAR